jgi:hypothetical protein
MISQELSPEQYAYLVRIKECKEKDITDKDGMFWNVSRTISFVDKILITYEYELELKDRHVRTEQEILNSLKILLQ